MKIVYKETELEKLYKRLDNLIESRDTNKYVAYIELTEDEWEVLSEDECRWLSLGVANYKGYALVEED